ncbi:MAG: hypothetical protein ACFFC3_05925 [Candidatus Odinarchaeota archaeon]
MIEEKKKKLRGLAGILSKQIEPLNELESFKEKFKDTNVKVLLNAKDGKWAALLVIDKGKIYVEGIKNEPKQNLKKKNVGWDGFFQATMPLFLEIFTNRDNFSKGKAIKKILSRKMKIRGVKHVLVLLKLFEL